MADALGEVGAVARAGGRLEVDADLGQRGVIIGLDAELGDFGESAEDRFDRGVAVRSHQTRVSPFFAPPSWALRRRDLAKGEFLIRGVH